MFRFGDEKAFRVDWRIGNCDVGGTWEIDLINGA